MRQASKNFLIPAVLLASSVKLEAQHVVLDGTAAVRIFTNIAGTAIADLKAAAGYPDTPHATDTAKFIEYPNGTDNGAFPPPDVGTNYGIIISGFLIVDRTDNYVFWLASDDNGEFWLSTDSTAGHLALICREPSRNPIRSYLKDASGGRSDIAPENVSAPQHLVQGTKYFFTGYMKEGSGGNNFAVAARVVTDNPPPDGSFPIFNAAVSSGISIVSQPEGQAGAAGLTATFNVGVSGPAFFQWQKNGIALPGATSQSYTTPPLVLDDSGTKYSVVVTPASGAPVSSAEAALTVVGTRLYTQGAIEYASWLSNSAVATIDAAKSALGNPIGSYGTGGGRNPSLRMAVDAFDSRVAYPDNSHENYTGAMFGYFIPDEDGTYYFHLKSDDSAQLFFNWKGSALPDLFADLNDDGVPDSLVAVENGCCNNFQPSGDIRTGGPFSLKANQKYGIVGIYREGTGDDYLQVAVTRDGVVTGLDESDLRNQSTIPSKYLAAVNGLYAPDLAIAAQPQNLFVEDNRSGTFSVSTTAAPGISYQWESAPAGSSTFTSIPGATSAWLSVTAISGASGNNGSQYRVKLHAQDQDITSDVAILMVRPDETSPRLTNAFSSPNLDAIIVSFDEPVISAGATFAISGGGTVAGSEQMTDTVILLHLVAALSPSTSYNLTADGVKDAAGNVAVQPNNTIAFTSGALPNFPPPPQIKVPGYASFQRYDGETLNSIQSRIENGPPPEIYTIFDHFDQPANQADNYTSLKYGWFVPPITGSYVFFTACDDSGRLYLSTDANPANKKLIASEANWSNIREWTTSAGGSPAAEKRSDQYAATEWPCGKTIILVEGEPYYVEQRQAGASGGDWAAATFKFASEPDPVNGSESRITGPTIFTYVPPDKAPLRVGAKKSGNQLEITWTQGGDFGIYRAVRGNQHNLDLDRRFRWVLHRRDRAEALLSRKEIVIQPT